MEDNDADFIELNFDTKKNIKKDLKEKSKSTKEIEEFVCHINP